MKRLLFVVTILALFAAPLFAQTAPPTVTVGQGFKIAADHDGVNTAGYRLYVDSAKVGVDIPLTALAAGTVTVDVPAIATRGAHALQLAAYNADAETKSDPVAFQAVLASPSKPKNIRLIVILAMAADGSVSFRVVDAAEVDPESGGE
jgi:hypothetical protein